MDVKDYRHLPKTGGGSSRTVYDAGKVVAKCASGEQKRLQRGLAQNRAEYTAWENSTYDGLTILCPVKGISNDDEVLLMNKAISVGKIANVPDEYRDGLRLLKRRLKYLNWLLQGEKSKHRLDKKACIARAANKDRAEEMRKFFRSKMFQDLVVLVFDYRLMLGDICRLSSWGIYRGNFVLIDYGLTEEVYRDHYTAKRRY